MSQKPSPTSSPIRGPKKATSIGIKSVVPSRKQTVDQQEMDLSALNLKDDSGRVVGIEDTPKITIAREKVLEEAGRALDAENQTGKKSISIVVIGKWLSLKMPHAG